jgi:hypothetical protein
LFIFLFLVLFAGFILTYIQLANNRLSTGTNVSKNILAKDLFQALSKIGEMRYI